MIRELKNSCRYSLGLNTAAQAVESAVRKVLDNGLRTADLKGATKTNEFGDAVVAALKEFL